MSSNRAEKQRNANGGRSPTRDHPTRRGWLVFLGVSFFGAAAGLWRKTGARSGRLRPPGGQPEDAFLARCIRCQQCTQACPVGALRAAGPDWPWETGTPHFVARQRPCDLCGGREAMACIAACPTGALQPITDRRKVTIGTAVVAPDRCLPFQGVVCRACWRACPFPDEAIRLDDRGRPVVNEDACTGCGLCEHACLTDPPSIVVEPGKRSRDARAT